MNQKTKATLEEIVALVKENPQLAKEQEIVEARWVENAVCEIKSGDHVLITDERRPVGTEKGPEPALLVLAGLAGCTATSFAMFSIVMGIPVDSIEVSVTADLDLRGVLGLEESVPVGYTDIRYEARIRSSASEKEIRELAAIVERRCPVYDTLTRPKEIEGKVSLNGKILA